MGLIKNLLSGMSKDKKEFKDKFKQAEQDFRIQKMIEERQKSSNERELDNYIKQQREDKIKAELGKIHKKQNKELWNSPNKILNNGTSVLRTDRPILKEKNIFKNTDNLFDSTHSREHSMGFFK